MALQVGDRLKEQAGSTERATRAGMIEEVVLGDPSLSTELTASLSSYTSGARRSTSPTARHRRHEPQPRRVRHRRGGLPFIRCRRASTRGNRARRDP